jgi:hypothetical protein
LSIGARIFGSTDSVTRQRRSDGQLSFCSSASESERVPKAALRDSLRFGCAVHLGDTVAVTKREGIDPDVLHRRAQVELLARLARGGDAHGVMAAVAPHHVPGQFSPDVALLELAVTALDLACPPGAEPLGYDGLLEHYLPEVTFRGPLEHRISQYALYAATCIREGYSPTCSVMPAGGRRRCDSPRLTPSSSTAGQRPSDWRCR